MQTQVRGKVSYLKIALMSAMLVGGAMTAQAHVGSHLQGGKASIVTIKLKDYNLGLRQLISEGFDIAGVDVTNGTVDVVVGQAVIGELSALQLGKITQTKDVNPEVAPDPGYKTYAELTTILEEYRSRFPGILSVESIGKSHEGRDIWAVKISDNVDAEENEPVVFFNAMHHAREVMTTEIAIDIIDQLTSTYASNSRTQSWVNDNVIWIVPMVNPDGNNKVWTANNMWRKNTREGYGVDINRNYPYAWGTCNGSSGSTYSDTYRGPAAGSEPETQAMMGLVNRIKPVLSISYHSYSELVIYPYGCDGEHTPDRDVVESLGRQLAGRLPKDGSSGTYDPGTSWELLYAVDGGDIDWYYNEHQVLPYVIEVSSSAQGFQPPFSWRQRTVEKNRAGWGFMIDRLAQSGIRASVSVDNQMAVDGTVTLTPMNQSAVSAESGRVYKVKSDGTFHIVAEPGMYKLTVTSGDKTETREIMVAGQREDMVFKL
jgi:carboxypeptidase T